MGLVPSWAKDRKLAASLINARSETFATKLSFRSAFKRRRCLIRADGYYEWQKAEKQKQPHLFRLRDRQRFAFAGLWEVWHAEDGEVVESCMISTTDPNDLAKTVHDRMPVIIPPERYDDWLKPTADAQRLLSVLGPYPADIMEAIRVGTTVNNTRHDVPACIVPLTQ